METKAESKRDRFKRLAEKRVESAIHRIELLGNLSNRGSYEFTDADVAQIFEAILEEIETARSRFSKPVKRNEFTLL